MNKHDHQIITNLRKNARMPLSIMSRKTRIPVSTIFDKLKTYQDSIISRHTSIVNFEKLGYTARASFSIKVSREDKYKLKDYLLTHHCMNSVYRINNGFDFQVEGIFKDLSEMEDFTDTLDQRFDIVEIKSHFIIEDLKRESFMSSQLLPE